MEVERVSRCCEGVPREEDTGKGRTGRKIAGDDGVASKWKE